MRRGLSLFLKRVAPILLVVSILAAGWAFVFVVPDILVHSDLVPDGVERIKQRQGVRSALLQSLVGILVLIGAYITAQQVRVSRQGQLTERFTRATDQLGSDKLNIRLGGIYALERIAKDSEHDRNTICEILSAFVRDNSPWPPKLAGQYTQNAPLPEIPSLQSRAPDIQAAMNVLGRLPPAYGRMIRGMVNLLASTPDLGSVDLRRLILAEPDLHLANFERAHLERAFLYKANLVSCA
jgi:hypothetical protein